jgi:hypothetical protein
MSGQRRTDHLLTVDRALLVLAISAGMWAGTAASRIDGQVEKIAAVEKRQDTAELRQDQAMREKAQAELGTTRELATVTTRLNEIDRRTENIEKGVDALAAATAALANRVKDQEND